MAQDTHHDRDAADRKWFPHAPTFSDVHHEQVCYHVPGRSPIAGVYKGKRGYLRLLDRATAVAEADPAFDLTWNVGDTFENDRHAVMLATFALTVKGRQLRSGVVVVLDYKDGKVHDVWLVPTDLIAIDAMLLA